MNPHKKQVIDPNKIMLAENMAKHFTNTLREVKQSRGVRIKSWALTNKDHRRDLIDTFIIILGAADVHGQKAEEPKLINPIKPL